MSKFNSTQTAKTTNKSGHKAYKLHDKEDLVSKVLTSFFNENKFYGDTSNDLVHLAQKTDPKFVSKLAIYARREMNLRSVSHVLTCIVAISGGGQLTRDTVNGVVVRPDDILEIMECYKQMYGKPFPNALKRQVAIEMNSFNDYKFAKYNGGNKAMSFKDVLKITHAKPDAKHEKTFARIMNDNLPIPHTWETELSANGNNKETWEKLIDSGDVGYMALLRNLRNIIKAKPKNMDKVLNILSDPERVRTSRQLPFRFYSAYGALADAGLASTKVVDTLEDAMEVSCENIERLRGKTLVAIDVSGSMRSPVSRKSDVRCVDIASVMGAIATRICEDADVVTFDTRLYRHTLSTRSGIISNARSLSANGGGTNIALPFKDILQRKEIYDRVILLSDNEINSQYMSGGWNYREPVNKIVEVYRKEVNPNFWVHAIDLAGYGTTQFTGKNTNLLSGWSERVFDFIDMAEMGMGSMVKAIEGYQIKN